MGDFFQYGSQFLFFSRSFNHFAHILMSIERVFEGGQQICAPIFDGHGIFFPF